MKKVLALLLILIGCVLIILFSVHRTTPQQKPLRIGIEVWAGYAYAYLAQEKGFFKKNGVDVELVLAANSKEARKQFAEGQIDGWFDVFPEVVTGYSQGILARVVWVVDYSDSADVIIGKKELTSIEDLSGKRIGVEGMNSFSHMQVLELMNKHGVKESDVRFELVNPMDILTELEKGTIDAGHTWEPITSQALGKGYKILGKAGEIPGLITDVLFLSPKVINERPDKVQAVLRSFTEAIEYMRKNPDESLKIMAAHEKMTVEQLSSDLKGIHLLDLAENAEVMCKPKSTQSLYFSADRIIEFFMKRGQIMYKPDVGELIEPRFVKELSGSK
jgi:NitT/TauT family transport system substrate-binding protein